MSVHEDLFVQSGGGGSVQEATELSSCSCWTDAQLSDMGLLYCHAVEPRISGASDAEGPVLDSLEPLRAAFKVRLLPPNAGSRGAYVVMGSVQCRHAKHVVSTLVTSQPAPASAASCIGMLLA